MNRKYLIAILVILIFLICGSIFAISYRKEHAGRRSEASLLSAHITPTSTGVAYVQSYVSDDGRMHPSRRFIFIPQDETLGRLIAAFDGQGPFKIMDGKLYFVSDQGLASIDLSGKIVPIVDLPAGAGSYIPDYLLDRGHLYYLIASKTSSTARNDLFDYDWGSGHSALLAENIPYFRIIGFDADSQKLYLANDGDDPSCGSLMYGDYSIITGWMSEIKEIRYCAGGLDAADPNDPELAAYAKLKQRLGEQYPASSAILIRNGRVVGPAAASTADPSWFNITFAP